MENNMFAGTNKILFLSFLLILTNALFLATSHEVDDESEFSYDKESENGPAHWGEIHPEWKMSHWHSPSEHTINGRRFDLEVHLVHESVDGKTAVVGIMYKIGRADSFLSMIESDLKALAHTKGVERKIGVIDPKKVKLGSRKYYRYIGSLTVPPCTQDVVWTIVRKVRTVTKEQMKLIREAVHDESETNSRPVQPANKRTIRLYRPNDPKE
ncbi:hypothetical protein HAX54_026444 [Datura stramonium]|uniref:Carbonic anhydrase n=1 Tax=Datura stramonium TaxID=4076 RepID=A0ABS8V330_DATST|nr:hypothetical protein [Datura stramonium]